MSIPSRSSCRLRPFFPETSLASLKGINWQVYSRSRRQGKRAEAEKQIELLRELAKTRYVRPYYIAHIYAALGDKDQAFAELERSFAERDCYLSRIAMDPFVDPLRDDPRFKSLLKRMNLPE